MTCGLLLGLSAYIFHMIYTRWFFYPPLKILLLISIIWPWAILDIEKFSLFIEKVRNND